MAFTDLSFPNNELRNTSSRIVYSKKDQIFISTNGVSAKVGARHSGPGKHLSQSARILLCWGLKQSRSNKEIFAAFPQPQLNSEWRNIARGQKITGNLNTDSSPWSEPLPVMEGGCCCNSFTKLLSWLVKLKVVSQMPWEHPGTFLRLYIFMRS